MWFNHESTHQNEINIINFTKVLFKYVVDKKSIIFYRHNVPLAISFFPEYFFQAMI